jgi:hypothetical protein
VIEERGRGLEKGAFGGLVVTTGGGRERRV